MSDVKISYETLFDLLRREKNREELQQVDSSFFDDVIKYLQDKVGVLHEQERKQDLLGSTERNKTKNQLDNIKKILTEFYERREQKILKMALNMSKTGSNTIKTSSLLKEEKKLYDEMVTLLDSYRNGVLNNLLKLKMPEVLKSEAQVETEKQETIQKEKEAEAMRNMEQDKTRLIFLNNIDAFVGPDLETIGPFAADQEAELPKRIADVLINKGDAEKV